MFSFAVDSSRVKLASRESTLHYENCWFGIVPVKSITLIERYLVQGLIGVSTCICGLVLSA